MCPAQRCRNRRQESRTISDCEVRQSAVAAELEPNINPNFYPVILAGGRGTRFWPLSRKRRAKQLLALDGKQTMIQQAVGRLLPISSLQRLWVITNEDCQREIGRQLPRLNKKQTIAEPAGRNTAPAIGLAAFILLRQDADAVLGLFPSDHVIGDERRYREVLEQGIA